MQPAIHRDHLPGGFAEALADEEEVGLGLVGGRDGRLGQGAVGVELGQFLHEGVGRLIIRIGNIVFGERSDDPVAREHRGALHDGGGGDAVDSHQRREFDGELADEVVAGGLGDVVGDGAFFRDGSVGRGREDERALEALLLPRLPGLVADEVAAGDVDGEGDGPLVVGDVAGGVARHEDAGGDANGVEATVGQRNLVEHLADAGAVGDVGGETDGRAAIGEAGAGDADAHAVLVGDFLRGGRCGLGVEVDAHDVCAFLDETVGGLLADAGAGADHHDDLPGELRLGRHALQFRLLEEPVLDVEGLLLRQRDILVDGLGAAHHLDSAVVELGGDAALGLVLAPGDQAQARDEHDGRVWVAHRRRVGVFAALVVSAVILPVLGDAIGEELLQVRHG